MAFISFITAAVTAISAWAAAYPILAGLAQSAFAVAASFGINKIFAQKVPSTSAQLQTEYGANNPRTVVLGTCGLTGRHVYRNNFGSGGRNFQDVYELASFRITGVPRVRYNGKWRTLTEQNAEGFWLVPNEGTSGDNHDDVRVKFYFGSMDQQAEPTFIANSRPAGRWTAAHRGAGVAYAVVYSGLRRQGNGLAAPAQLLFEVKGAPLYDWRKDSSVGGFGPHRWNDQSTWEYSDNPFVQAYNLERGFYNGNQLMVGKGVRASRLPLSEWTQAANIADEIIDGDYRYRSHMIAKDGPGANHDSNLQPLLMAACASWVERVDGEFPIAGAPQAVVATITDDDIKIGAPKRFTVKRKRTDLINTVAASYVSPDDFYETKDAATRIDQSALAEDRETLASAIPYGAVTNVKQVDRLADIAIRGARFQASAEITIHPRFLDVVKEGRWITWASAKHGTRTYQVLTRTLGPHNSDGVRDITVALQEISNGVFDPTAYATNPPVIIVVPPPQYLAEVQNFAATPNIVQAEGGGKLPGVRLTWDQIEDISVSGVLIEYWPVANPTQVFTKAVTADISVVQIVEGLTSETDWQVRTTLMVDNGRAVSASGITNFRTLQAGGDLITNLENLGQDVRDTIALIGGARQELLNRIEQIGQAVSLEAALSQIQRDTMRAEVGGTYAEIETVRTVAATETEAVAQRVTTLSAVVGDTSAKLIEEQQVRATADSAFTTQLTSLNATVGQNTAAIGTEATARVNADGAISQQIIGVSATFNGMFADGLVMFQATATPAGVSARFAVLLRGNTGSGFVESGMYIQLRTVNGVLKSEVGFLADKFVVINGDQSIAVFAIENGIVKIPNLQVSQAQIISLFIGDEQIVPGSVIRIRSASTSSNNAPGYAEISLTVDHGVRANPSNPILIRVEYTATGKANQAQTVLVGPHLIDDVTGGGSTNIYTSNANTAVAGDAFRDYTAFRTFTVPNRASTVLRLRLPSESAINWTAMVLSAMAFRNN
ncbi:hypothetical protein GGQ73_000636 [Rhizobium skierniewicense]|uniref:Tip attachment protein J central straight fiber domain-containing protein n=1 Tax=Rhizobium skierniewicense TaxID=984260 RepID=A0A7W6C4L5_9HYPH|nr:DUF1983 domain-containing protein [Rhizobium skierniewicense]MBB3944711.1 hypothetical protein [Rhizobium skierniewicense]